MTVWLDNLYDHFQHDDPIHALRCFFCCKCICLVSQTGDTVPSISFLSCVCRQICIEWTVEQVNSHSRSTLSSGVTVRYLCILCLSFFISEMGNNNSTDCQKGEKLNETMELKYLV